MHNDKSSGTYYISLAALLPFFLVRISLVFHKTLKINFKLLTFCVVSAFAKQNNTKPNPCGRQISFSYRPASACDVAPLSDACCHHLTKLASVCAAATLFLRIATAKYSSIMQSKRKKVHENHLLSFNYWMELKRNKRYLFARRSVNC